MAEELRVPVLDSQKTVTGELVLPAAVFGSPVRRHLLHDVVKMQRANRRAGTAATKTRGEVRGGGRKPWRQKGTGRARAGSIRSPIWVGGGTVFGPQPRDYSYLMPKSARRAALRSALALKAKEGKLLVLDRLEIDPPKTKVVAGLLSTLGVRSALIVTDGRNESLERAARNLPRVKVLRVEGLNVYDLLCYEHLLLPADAVEAVVRRAEP